jgi:hypothetical protein
VKLTLATVDPATCSHRDRVIDEQYRDSYMTGNLGWEAEITTYYRRWWCRECNHMWEEVT